MMLQRPREKQEEEVSKYLIFHQLHFIHLSIAPRPAFTRPLARFRITERLEEEQLTTKIEHKVQNYPDYFPHHSLKRPYQYSLLSLLSLPGRITLPFLLRSPLESTRSQIPYSRSSPPHQYPNQSPIHSVQPPRTSSEQERASHQKRSPTQSSKSMASAFYSSYRRRVDGLEGGEDLIRRVVRAGSRVGWTDIVFEVVAVVVAGDRWRR